MAKVTIYGLFMLLLSAICSSSLTRKLSYELNPNCEHQCEHLNLTSTEFNNLVHVKAIHEKDVLHFLWSTVGAPTILIAKTAKGVDVHVDWKKLISEDPSKSVTFTGKVDYSFAAIMSRIYEYNDKHSDAKITSKNYKSIRTYNLNELTWEDVSKTLKGSSSSVKATFVSSNYSQSMLNDGTIKIKVSASGKDGKMSESPHQLFTSNSSMIDFTIDEMKASYEKSRLMAEVIFVSFDGTNQTVLKKDKIEYEVRKTIDDEYTPSIFEIYNVETPGSKKKDSGGFMQFKPIAYMSTGRKYRNSTAMNVNNLDVHVNSTIIPKSIAYAYYGHDASKAHIANLTMKFGVDSGTDFYTTANFSSWTLAVGYGSPPEEEISLTIILVISIGLGLPLLVLASGCGYIGFKKLRGNNKNGRMLIVNVDEE